MEAQTARAALKTYLDNERAAFLENPGFMPVEERICRKVDEVVTGILRTAIPNDRDFALMAIGGYGRGALHPESDLDLLLYFTGDIDERIVKAALNPLWDLPFRIGHQVRQASDFKAFDPEQVESYAAFLDDRYLAGSPQVAAAFRNDLFAGFIRRNRDAFLKGLVESKRLRYSRFGHTVFQLEPDLKDAPGGVRDFHWADWVRKALEAPAESGSSGMSAFHHCLRNFLHFKVTRNFNVLSYEFQEDIAPKLGYRDSAQGEAAEKMMRDYFLRAADIARRASMWEEEVIGHPERIAIQSDFRDPFETIEAFAEAHRRKASLHAVTLAAIRQRMSVADGILANNPRAGRLVLEMMKDRKGIYRTLLSMHHVGLLGRIFPDFEDIRCRVIRDFFHRYTVDEHSLIAIRNIEELPEKHRLGSLVGELEYPELLLLSLLFHDIGKAHRHDEGNHVHPGAEGVRVILKDLELPEEQTAKVVFAIKNHLEMSKIIMRRDFSDENVIRQFSELVGDVDNLRMLTLVTYADVKAVNNEVLTPWKEDLLWQLYVETYSYLTVGFAEDRYDQQPALENDIAGILESLPGKTPSQDVRDFLDGFPRQYLRSTPKTQIAEHFLLSRKLATLPMVMHFTRRDGGVYELLVMTPDRPFLFSKITGVLSYFGMNILRAQAFSNRHGTIFDLITFQDVEGYFDKNPTEKDRFSKMLGEAIDGRIELDSLLKGKMMSVLFQRRGGYALQPAIHFDQDFSKTSTIMEIVALDAFGLLYRVASVISSYGCNIEVALISTEGQRAIDVFYLTHGGQKVPPDLERKIAHDLGQMLAQA
ncbi:MAG TPA: HD domain-containing protein [Terriglobia bacterium]|nr:HD domain-containing protein [Terriglobia bacterium]